PDRRTRGAARSRRPDVRRIGGPCLPDDRDDCDPRELGLPWPLRVRPRLGHRVAPPGAPERSRLSRAPRPRGAHVRNRAEPGRGRCPLEFPGPAGYPDRARRVRLLPGGRVARGRALVPLVRRRARGRSTNGSAIEVRDILTTAEDRVELERYRVFLPLREFEDENLVELGARI